MTRADELAAMAGEILRCLEHRGRDLTIPRAVEAARVARAPVPTPADREARRGQINAVRPPSAWLAGPAEPWRRYVTVDGLIMSSPYGPRYWGPG